jgi:hypothetical protein
MRPPLFRRTDKTADQHPEAELKEGGKGRPTPSRKEAEAAARERARGVMDKKAASKLLNERRAVSNAQRRAGIKSGDEKFLMPRDQGSVRRFIRDYIDSRICVGEFVLPLLIVIMVLQYSKQAALSGGLMSAMILVVAVDTIWMNFRLKRELKRRFPDESLRGTTLYSFMRVLQTRFLRLPKPQVKVGQKLPERY